MRFTWIVFIVLATANLARAYPGGPPDERAGDPPNNRSCNGSGCHAGSPGTVSPIQITAPLRYLPGNSTPLTIGIAINSPQTIKNGFEIVAKDSTHTIKGTLATNADGRTQVSSGYGKHTLTGNQFSSWTMKWTPPATPGAGTITLYAAGNASNNDGQCTNGGDRISLDSVQIEENFSPTVPASASPADEAVVAALQPTLVVAESSDANDDTLTYDFQVCADQACTNIVQSTTNVAGNGTTAEWQVSSQLTEETAYWWQARANDGYVTTAWSAARKFTVSFNTVPTAPSPNGPANGVVMTTNPVALSINLAADVDTEDTLLYFFDLCSDAACGTVTSTSPSVVTAPEDTTAAWTTGALSENAKYFWRARANDGTAYGPYMTPISFWVNAITEPPAQPAITEPFPDGRAFGTPEPTVSVGNSVDPDPFAGLPRYDFTLATDALFMSVVSSATNVPQGGGGQTSWTFRDLTDQVTYYLRVLARDADGNASPATNGSFSVNLGNDPPSTPANLAPDGSTVTTNPPELSADAATDGQLDDILTYFFDLDTEPDFATPLEASSGLASPAWSPTVPLADQRYYWRVRAFDGSEFSPAAFASFWLNAVNDAPSAPAPSAPLNSGQVNTRFPTLRAAIANDAEDDVLLYQFQIAQVADFATTVQASTDISPSGDEAAWMIPLALADNQTYYWRVRAVDANDSTVAGAYSAAYSFQIVNGNLPPDAPTVTAEHSQAAVEPVVFSVLKANDPDGDAVSLYYEIYLDSSLQQLLAASPAIPGSAPTWEPADIKWTRGVYYWRVQAEDASAKGAWSPTAKLELTVTDLPFDGEKFLLPITEYTITHPASNSADGCNSANGGGFGLLILPLGWLLLRRRSAAWLLVIYLAACGSDDVDQAARIETKTAQQEPTYKAVREILDTRCILCHSGSDAPAGLDLSAEKIAQTAIGRPPENPVAAGRGFLRIDPGNPANSFLLYKITEPGLGEGAPMPFERKALAAGDVAIIRDWIKAGAATE